MPSSTTATAGTSLGRRVSDTFDQLKAEYEAALQHAHVTKQAQLEMERRIQSQVAEMAHMQQILTALEATYRRVCREYDHEVARLRREMEARNKSATTTTEQPRMMPSTTKRLRTTVRSSDAASTPIREDGVPTMSIVNAVATEVAAPSRQLQLGSVVSREDSTSIPRAYSSLEQIARATRMTVPQSNVLQPKQLNQHVLSSPSPRLSPQRLDTSKSSGQHQASPRIASTLATEDDSSRPAAQEASTTTLRQESDNQPPSPPPVASRDAASVVPDKLANNAADKQSPSKSTKSLTLDWKCTYPSKSALPSMMPRQKSERPVAELHHAMDLQSAVCTVRFSRDGTMVAAGCLKSAQVFNVETGERVFVTSHHTDTGTVAADQAVTRTASKEEQDDGHVRAACFSSGSTKLVVGMPHNTIRTWDIASKTEGPAMTGHESGIYALDCINDIIVSGSGDRTVRLWDARSGQCKKIFGSGKAEHGGPLDGVTSVALSPHGGRLLASGSLDKVVRIWDTETSQLLARFDGHSDSVYSVAFSSDGRQLVSGSFDRTIMLWDVGNDAQAMRQAASARPRMVFQGHRNLVLSVAYTPDGRYLVSGSKDRSVRFWDPRSTRSELTLTGHRNSVIGVASSPVSPYFATAGGDGVAALWKYQCESL